MYVLKYQNSITYVDPYMWCTFKSIKIISKTKQNKSTKQR
jgi:hypothetical protein